MSSKKKGLNPWVFTVIFGVLIVLFSFYALTEQSMAMDSKKEVEKLKAQLVECEKMSQAQAEEAKLMLEKAVIDATIAKEEAEIQAKKKK